MSDEPTHAADPATIPVPAVQYLVPLRDAERELSRQMKRLQGDPNRPLQRARMSNLVIFCTSLEQSILLNEQVPAISVVHPARAILLVGEPGHDRELTARVTVRPLGPDAKHYACAEQVTLHAGGNNVERLPFAVRALVIGDLPVNLWWATPTPPALAGALLHELAEDAQQIIYDSVGWPDPARGVSTTGSWLEQVHRPGVRWRVASDVNWRRLKYWRRLLAESLGGLARAGGQEAVSEIHVEHGPHGMVQGWLLASWLANGLGWKVQVGKVTPGRETVWRFRTSVGEGSVFIRRQDEGPAEVLSVRILVRIASETVTLRLAREGENRLAAQVEASASQPRTITTPPASPAELVGRQLSDRERDPVFRDSMATAAVMAQSLLK
jgi:glucose-6-phosphate dehydrogenase assembly protein OpcA